MSETKFNKKTIDRIEGKLEAGIKLTDEEALTYKNYINKRADEQISSKQFRNMFRDSNTGIGLKKVSNKLRDSQKKPIKLIKNTFKVVSKNPNDLVESQLQSYWKISLKNYKTPQGEIINVSKNIWSYSKNFRPENRPKEKELLKMLEEQAKAIFVASLNLNVGSGKLNRYIHTELLDTVYVSFINYREFRFSQLVQNQTLK